MWNAVKKAKDLNINSKPDTLTLNSVKIIEDDPFADFFSNKVKNLVNECKIDDAVYNGSPKLNSVSENFMTPKNLVKAIKSL